MNDLIAPTGRPRRLRMPFTPNRQFAPTPRLLVAAKGMYYRTDDAARSPTEPGPVVRSTPVTAAREIA